MRGFQLARWLGDHDIDFCYCREGESDPVLMGSGLYVSLNPTEMNDLASYYRQQPGCFEWIGRVGKE